MSERKRGCGFREIGGLYLTCDPGQTLICDGLPLPLEPCECCGFAPPFTRNIQRINPAYIMRKEAKKHNVHTSLQEFVNKCKCPSDCPVCYPMIGYPYGLMYVSKHYYSPKSFILEAEKMGVCKRIPQIPRWLTLGETWVYLAHQKVPKISLEKLTSNEMYMKEPEHMKAIFYAYRPQRIEMPVWKGDLTEEQLQILRNQGITPVILVPTAENRKQHRFAKTWGKNLDRYLGVEEEQGE